MNKAELIDTVAENTCTKKEAQQAVAEMFAETKDWYDEPINYTVSQLKNMINRENPTAEQLQTLYDNEAQSEKPRKTLLSFVKSKLG